MPLQEALEAGGHEVSWSQEAANGPPEDQGSRPFDAVVLGTDGSRGLREVIDAYRALDPVPAVVVAVGTEAEAALAREAQVPAALANGPQERLRNAVTYALEHRFASRMSLAMARGALGVEVLGDEADQVATVVRASRQADIGLVQEALRWYPRHYVTATDRIAELREERVLHIPEVELVKLCDGTRTLQTLVRAGVMEPPATARLVWALVSVDGLTLTEEPPDAGSTGRRAVIMARAHLRARTDRLDASTYYDVLELTPSCEIEDIERALELLARRYSPQALGDLDLGGLAATAESLWQQILKARATLSDWASRGRYNDWLQKNGGSLRTEWAVGMRDSRRAEGAYARGQKLLVDGDPHGAVSQFAAAARAYPDHPDYECSLLWARFRSDIARGVEREESASKYRREAEAYNLGKRPWPRALVALALLCAADGDSGAARWFVREALEIDSSLPAARKLWNRLAG